MSEWQLIETAPKDGTRILLVERGGVIVLAAWDYSIWITPSNDWIISHDRSDTEIAWHPTHWMALPPIPDLTAPTPPGQS